MSFNRKQEDMSFSYFFQEQEIIVFSELPEIWISVGRYFPPNKFHVFKAKKKEKKKKCYIVRLISIANPHVNIWEPFCTRSSCKHLRQHHEATNKFQISDRHLNFQHLLMDTHSTILWQILMYIMKYLAYSISFHVEKDFFFSNQKIPKITPMYTRHNVTWYDQSLKWFFFFLVKV